MAHIELMAANNENDDEKIGAALQKEFVSGMQAIVASSMPLMHTMHWPGIVVADTLKSVIK